MDKNKETNTSASVHATSKKEQDFRDLLVTLIDTPFCNYSVKGSEVELEIRGNGRALVLRKDSTWTMQ